MRPKEAAMPLDEEMEAPPGHFGLLDALIAQKIEAAYREGWGTGYSAGIRDDAASGTYWCDKERDWTESEAAKILRARSKEPDNGR
jgi:hypothetical protein